MPSNDVRKEMREALVKILETLSQYLLDYKYDVADSIIDVVLIHEKDKTEDYLRLFKTFLQIMDSDDAVEKHLAAADFLNSIVSWSLMAPVIDKLSKEIVADLIFSLTNNLKLFTKFLSEHVRLASQNPLFFIDRKYRLMVLDPYLVAQVYLLDFPRFSKEVNKSIEELLKQGYKADRPSPDRHD